MSKAIAERLADSKSTKRQIEESRERYRPVAARGSLLYFTVAELCRVDVMYQYSLDYFQVQRDLRCKYPPLTFPLGYDWQEVPRSSKAFLLRSLRDCFLRPLGGSWELFF